MDKQKVLTYIEKELKAKKKMNLKKLISFVVKDEFSLADSEIQKRAENVAQEQAIENGWANILVKASGSSYLQENKFTCYPFDVFGIEGGAGASGGWDDSSDD